MYGDIDLGNLTSREIGELLNKPMIERGKKAARLQNTHEEVDYGDLPSRALASMGKQAVNDQLNEK